MKDGGVVVWLVFIGLSLFQIYGGYLLLSIHSLLVHKKSDIFELESHPSKNQ